MSENAKFELASISWDEDELAAIKAVMDTGKFTMGHHVATFEEMFADRFGAQFAVMSNSGSSANLLAVAAMRYSQWGSESGRDEIIVPAVSWSTTYYPVHQMGYKLKFVDIDLETLNAAPDSVERAINEKTAGIFAVNLLGNPSDLEALQALAEKYGLFLLEDNCESMGAVVNGKQAGSFGKIGTFSTYFSHHISTMEGGVSITDDVELAQLMRSLRAHGWVRELPIENSIWPKSGDDFEDAFKFILPGWNLRPIEMAGAIGQTQLQKFDGFLHERRKNARSFKEIMRGLEGYIFQKELHESSWFGFSIILTGKNLGKRAELVRLLRAADIECRPIVAGDLTKNPVLKYLNHADLEHYPNANLLHSNGLFVGNHHYPISGQLQRLRSILESL